MPLEKFDLYRTPDETLKVWARKLNYLFKNLDLTNINSTTILGTDSVKDFMIDFGTGLQQVDALDVPIVDSSSNYTSTSVEGALQEVGTHIATTNIHFLTSNISHTVIKDIGVNTHAQIDTHIATTNIHFLTSNISHTTLKDIGINTHAQIDTHIASTTNPHGSAYLVGNALSTTLTGTTTLTNAVALNSDLIATNNLLNQLRTALINNGLATT